VPWIFIAFFFLLWLPLVLAIIIPVYKNHYRATGNVVNYDSMMQKYVYKVYMSKENIISTLKEKNDIDDLSFKFDFEKSIVKISEYGSSREYFFDIKEYDGYSILKLNQVSLFVMSSQIPYKLNPFMVNKLNAEPIPFAQYGE